MIRVNLALAIWMSLVSATSASLTPPTDVPAFGKEFSKTQVVTRLAEAPPRTGEAGSRSRFVVTEQTEILLNGQPCKYADIPRHATILKMEVAADKKTVLQIHFRTRK